MKTKEIYTAGYYIVIVSATVGGTVSVFRDGQHPDYLAQRLVLVAPIIYCESVLYLRPRAGTEDMYPKSIDIAIRASAYLRPRAGTEDMYEVSGLFTVGGFFKEVESAVMEGLSRIDKQYMQRS